MSETFQPKTSTMLPTRYGTFRLFVFEDDDGTAYSTLTTETVNDNPLVRVHSECETGDIFKSKRCDCGEQLEMSLEQIATDGNGIFIYMRGHEGRGIGFTNKIRAYALQDSGADTIDANHQLGFETDVRTYEIAAKILNYFSVKQIRLLTNNPDKIASLTSLGIEISKMNPITTAPNEHNEFYLNTKRTRMNHKL